MNEANNKKKQQEYNSQMYSNILPDTYMNRLSVDNEGHQLPKKNLIVMF